MCSVTVFECLDEVSSVSCLGQGSQGATSAGGRKEQIARTLQALHDVVTFGGVDDYIRRNDTSTNETIARPRTARFRWRS